MVEVKEPEACMSPSHGTGLFWKAGFSQPGTAVSEKAWVGPDWLVRNTATLVVGIPRFLAQGPENGYVRLTSQIYPCLTRIAK